MKNYIHRIATYTAVILISAMPFALEISADSEKNRNEISASLNAAEEDMLFTKRKAFGEEDE